MRFFKINKKKIKQKKHYNTTPNNFLFATFVLLSIAGFIFFLITTGLILNTLLILLLSVLIIYPYRNRAASELLSLRTNNRVVYKKPLPLIDYYLILLSIIFLFWLLGNLGTTIIPFVLALIIGYLLDPFVTKLEKIGIKRWISSLLIIIIAIGFVISLAIFLFPQLIEEASNITKQVNQYLKDVKQFSTNKNTTAMLKKLGLGKYTLKEAFDTELLPVLQDLSKTIFNYLFKLLLGISNLTTQLINIVLLPILTFYFLLDFGKIKTKLKNIIKKENETLYKYLYKLNDVIRIYIGWQITAALIVAILGSLVLTILDVPYSILIACIAGLINPIPFFGTIISLVIGALITLLVNDGNFFYNFGMISIVLLSIHFINAYLLEPNIAGHKIGLHPILMILSIFIFKSLFGILGMLVAVPITAVIVTFVKDMMEFYKISKEK